MWFVYLFDYFLCCGLLFMFVNDGDLTLSQPYSNKTDDRAFPTVTKWDTRPTTDEHPIPLSSPHPLTTDDNTCQEQMILATTQDRTAPSDVVDSKTGGLQLHHNYYDYYYCYCYCCYCYCYDDDGGGDDGGGDDGDGDTDDDDPFPRHTFGHSSRIDIISLAMLRLRKQNSLPNIIHDKEKFLMLLC